VKSDDTGINTIATEHERKMMQIPDQGKAGIPMS